MEAKANTTDNYSNDINWKNYNYRNNKNNDSNNFKNVTTIINLPPLLKQQFD
jgi:hypothetical protein